MKINKANIVFWMFIVLVVFSYMVGAYFKKQYNDNNTMEVKYLSKMYEGYEKRIKMKINGGKFYMFVTLGDKNSAECMKNEGKNQLKMMIDKKYYDNENYDSVFLKFREAYQQDFVQFQKDLLVTQESEVLPLCNTFAEKIQKNSQLLSQ